MDADISLNLNYYDMINPSDVIIEKCSKLFSEHYGIWTKTGHRVKMGSRFLKQHYLIDSRLTYAENPLTGQIVGHAVYKLFDVPDIGLVGWITQLVVHTEYRGHKIAGTLIRNVLHHEPDGVGLISSHPYAIKALERATRRTCLSEITLHHIQKIIDHSGIKYLQCGILKCDHEKSLIDTTFAVDHTEINKILDKMNDWRLGQLPDDHEFIGLILMGI